MIWPHDDWSVPSPSLTQESTEAFRQVTLRPWMRRRPISDFRKVFLSFLLFWDDDQVQTECLLLKQRNPTIKEEGNKQVEIIMFFNFLVAERNYVFAWGGGLSFKGNEGRLLVKKQFTSTSRSVSLKVTITDILIKTSSSMLVVFPLDGGDTVGTI